MNPLVSVIILNWNGRKFLKECLDSLLLQSYAHFEVVLVDNGSSDGSPEYVRSNYPAVKVVALPQNVGFAAGNNVGLEHCRGEFVVTLNNDTKVDWEFISALVAVVKADDRIGLVAAKMLNYYQTDRIDSVGLMIASNGLGYNKGIAEVDSGQYKEPAPVFGPCGGAALYRRAMLSETGFFDEDFFAYYEDFDLAWRCRLAGWQAVTAPGAVVYHVHSATSGEWSSFKVFHTHRNKWYVIIKNWPTTVLIQYLPKVLFYDIAALILAVMRGQGVSALKARLDLARHMPTLLRKRKKIKGGQKLSDGQVMNLFSPYESPIRTFTRKRGRKL
ncbi:glycosyltransferase family 2 protein [Geotalea sp. SG265]|uniref:glycosyltransferase family 2 protein n=1 Tax=Geotalea sp. SG265 TaxID=2922867 RepID=UPI001FAEB84D|nr:glycosyltransferase family 2 protein [Geotalea sp. SG265]